MSKTNTNRFFAIAFLAIGTITLFSAERITRERDYGGGVKQKYRLRSVEWKYDQSESNDCVTVVIEEATKWSVEGIPTYSPETLWSKSFLLSLSPSNEVDGVWVENVFRTRMLARFDSAETTANAIAFCMDKLEKETNKWMLVPAQTNLVE